MSDNINKRNGEIFPAILILVISIGFFGLISFLALHPVPPENKDLLNIMTGALGTTWTGGIAWWFGSSRGHERATELLANSNPPEQG